MLKKIQIYSLLITISFCFTQCRNNTVSKSKNKKFEENFGQKKQNLVGNWVSMEKNETIENLAKLVVKENNIPHPIRTIVNIEKQLVSGMNYRFVIILDNGEHWTTQIYVNTKNEKQITTFTPIKPLINQ
ncbi:MAG: hypothetical protein P8P73_03390 [Flavobacteriaceae bacterium]|jgi:hypothetical protein|nr:hypothetical protein [Flavobacteriaceae bacterium]